LSELIIELTRNQKHHLEGNAIPAAYSHAHMLLYVTAVNYNLNSYYMNYLHNSAADFVRFEKFTLQICESCDENAPSNEQHVGRLSVTKIHKTNTMFCTYSWRT